MPESFQLAEAICKLLGHDLEKFHGTFLYHINTYSLIFLMIEFTKDTESVFPSIHLLSDCLPPPSSSILLGFCHHKKCLGSLLN